MEQFTPQIFTSVINSYLPEPHASLLNGMLFGINLHTSKAFYEQLKIVGLLHIVVLSGINITLLAAIIALSTSFLGRLASSLITILTIILYIVFIGGLYFNFLARLVKDYILSSFFCSNSRNYPIWPN